MLCSKEFEVPAVPDIDTVAYQIVQVIGSDGCELYVQHLPAAAKPLPITLRLRHGSVGQMRIGRAAKGSHEPVWLPTIPLRVGEADGWVADSDAVSQLSPAAQELVSDDVQVDEDGSADPVFSEAAKAAADAQEAADARAAEAAKEAADAQEAAAAKPGAAAPGAEPGPTAPVVSQPPAGPTAPASPATPAVPVAKPAMPASLRAARIPNSPVVPPTNPPAT